MLGKLQGIVYIDDIIIMIILQDFTVNVYFTKIYGKLYLAGDGRRKSAKLGHENNLWQLKRFCHYFKKVAARAKPQKN